MTKSSSTTTQQSSTSPWSAAMPEVTGLLGQLQSQIPNVGLNSTEGSAINQLTAAGQAGNPYASGTEGAVNSLLAGGNATNQAGAVNDAFQRFQAQTNPLASNTNYNPYATPGFSDALNTANQDITNQINGQFAGAGRSFSGMNAQQLARGLSQGDAQLIANQYNQNVQNQQGAAGNLYNAGNTTANTLAGFNQQGVTNQQAGIGDVGTALNNSIWGPQTALAAQQQRQTIPAQNLGLLSAMGVPLAELGTNFNGTATKTSDPSLLTSIGQGTDDATKLLGLFAGL